MRKKSALIDRLLIISAGADPGHERFDIGVLGDDLGDLLLQLHHGVEGNILASLGVALKLAHVLVRNEALGDKGGKVQGGRERSGKQQHGQHPMPHHAAERPLVGRAHAVENLFRCAVNRIVLLRGRTQKPAAQHRRQAQGDKTRNQDRAHDRNGKFME